MVKYIVYISYFICLFYFLINLVTFINLKYVKKYPMFQNVNFISYIIDKIIKLFKGG